MKYLGRRHLSDNITSFSFFPLVSCSNPNMGLTYLITSLADRKSSDLVYQWFIFLESSEVQAILHFDFPPLLHFAWSCDQTIWYNSPAEEANWSRNNDQILSLWKTFSLWNVSPYEIGNNADFCLCIIECGLLSLHNHQNLFYDFSPYRWVPTSTKTDKNLGSHLTLQCWRNLFSKSHLDKKWKFTINIKLWNWYVS